MPNRRDFLRSAGIGLSGLAGLNLSGCTAEGRRPNIVFIVSDSSDGRVLGAMGHPAMRRATPNLDALAREGVLFRNAYTNNPICCPSRSSMWSGLYTYHCKAWNNYKGLSHDARTFLTELKNSGYHAKTFGQMDHFSGAHSVRDRVGSWTSPADIERPELRMPAPVVIPGDVARVHAIERNTWLGGFKIDQKMISIWPDWDRVDQTVAWIAETGAHLSQPFFLYLGITTPHPPFLTSEKYLRMIDESGVTLPALDAELHPVMRYQQITKNWEHGFSDDMVRSVRRVYFAMNAERDAMVGAVLAELKKQGLSDSTYIVFTGDHGENAMEHRQYYKMNHYESSGRVPMIIAGPGVRKGLQVDSPVSLIDIFPTFMDMARAPIPQGLDGQSLLPLCGGQPNKHPDWVFAEFNACTMQTGSFMLRRGDWKYIAYVGYEPQLFNLKEDPEEVRNLARTRPQVVQGMDRFLRSMVDYEAVDAMVKEYDKRSFRAWRSEMKAQGIYEATMARIFSGFDYLAPQQIKPWTAKDERQITRWLES